MKKTDTNLFNTLKERGLLYQCTDEEALKKLIESGQPITLYEGTDPTADSLHIGHCVPYCILRRFQKAGHKILLHLLRRLLHRLNYSHKHLRISKINLMILLLLKEKELYNIIYATVINQSYLYMAKLILLN